jgi:eukaryotic-like serine/threonine-protein kinase
MTCATVVVTVCAIFFDSWQSRRADRKVKQIETLTDSTISDMTEKLQQSSTLVETQVALFHSALQYLDKLRQSSGNDPRILLELAKAYERVGDLEGSPFGANLGDSEAALHSYQKALGAATEAHSRLPGDESTRALIEAYQRLARMEYSSETLRTLQKAADHFQQCLPLARAFWQQNPADPLRRGLVSANYSGLALVEEINREPDKALKNLRAALQILGSDLNGDQEHDLTLARLHISSDAR